MSTLTGPLRIFVKTKQGCVIQYPSLDDIDYVLPGDGDASENHFEDVEATRIPLNTPLARTAEIPIKPESAGIPIRYVERDDVPSRLRSEFDFDAILAGITPFVTQLVGTIAMAVDHATSPTVRESATKSAQEGLDIAQGRMNEAACLAQSVADCAAGCAVRKAEDCAQRLRDAQLAAEGAAGSAVRKAGDYAQHLGRCAPNVILERRYDFSE